MQCGRPSGSPFGAGSRAGTHPVVVRGWKCRRAPVAGGVLHRSHPPRPQYGNRY